MHAPGPRGSIALRWLACSAIGLAAACGSSPPVAPTAPTSAARSSLTFAIEMPLAPEDVTSGTNGINPFGVYLGDHGIDGHPGWDVEYRIGGMVRAAADGTIQTVIEQPNHPGSYVVQIAHNTGGAFRTVYNGLGLPLSGIVAGAAVHAGDALGLAGVNTLMIGTGLITTAGIHFQLDDFSYFGGLTNQNAVSPEGRLSPGARALFETMWTTASYSGELTEPFPTNPRGAPLPLTRRWTLLSGDLPNAIEFTRANGYATDYTYRLLDAGGNVTDTGTATITPWARPLTTIDLTPSNGGAPRLGLYDVVSASMRLVLSAPGGARPGSFAGTSVYTTVQ